MPRMFFALLPSPDQASAMAATARPLVQELGGKPVLQGDLHLTLCFLGEVAEAATAGLVRAAGTIHAPEIQLQFPHLDLWPGAQVLCALPDHGSGVATVINLAAQLRRVAQDAGIPMDPKPFIPHVTLGRRLRPDAVPVRAWPLRLPAPLQLETAGFALLRSTDVSAGRRYTVCHGWPTFPVDAQ